MAPMGLIPESLQDIIRNGSLKREIDIRIAAVVLLVITGAFLGLYLLFTGEPEAKVREADEWSKTHIAFAQALERVEAALTANKTPRSIDDLPTLEGREAVNIDGWGRPLILKLTRGGKAEVEIRSGGPDGQAGNDDDVWMAATVGQIGSAWFMERVEIKGSKSPAELEAERAASGGAQP